MLTEHPYVRPARPKESVQNVRARAVIAAIAPESGSEPSLAAGEYSVSNLRCEDSQPFPLLRAF